MDAHRRHHSACETIDPDVVDYRVFSRNAAERASTGTLKQPRLPGAEKFRFSQDFSTLRPASQRRSDSGLSPSIPRASKRRPILPISKNTSQVLNNTNAELSADTIDFIRNETSHLTNICKRYVNSCTTNGRDDEMQSDGWSCSSSEQSVEGNNSHNPPGKSGSDCINDPFEDRASPEMNNNSNKPEFAFIRSSRLRMRANKLNSANPEDDIWVLRSKFNQ